jgi:DNA-binding CsgD family transcriptional regulator
LTRRELEVLSLMATGFPNAAIADRLGIELATVKSHLSRAYRKLGVANRVEATRYHLEHHGPRASTPFVAEGQSAAGPGAPTGPDSAWSLEVEAQLRELRDEAERLRRRLEALRRPR